MLALGWFQQKIFICFRAPAEADIYQKDCTGSLSYINLIVSQFAFLLVEDIVQVLDTVVYLVPLLVQAELSCVYISAHASLDPTHCESIDMKNRKTFE